MFSQSYRLTASESFTVSSCKKKLFYHLIFSCFYCGPSYISGINDMLMIKHGFHLCYSAWLDDSCLIKQESFLQKHLSHYVLKKYFTVKTSTKCLKIYAFFKSLPYYGFHYIQAVKNFTVKTHPVNY